MEIGGGEKQEETVLWRGKPERTFFVEGADWILAAIGFAWSGINIWIIASYVGQHTGVSIFRAEWRLWSLAVGLLLTFGYPVIRFVRLHNTRYEVTDRRITVHVSGLRPSYLSMTYDMLPPPVLRDHGDDVGTIAFGELPGALETLTAALIRRDGSIVVLSGIWPAPKLLRMITEAREHAWASL